jgi:hypothetical protein
VAELIEVVLPPREDKTFLGNSKIEIPGRAYGHHPNATERCDYSWHVLASIVAVAKLAAATVSPRVKRTRRCQAKRVLAPHRYRHHTLVTQRLHWHGRPSVTSLRPNSTAGIRSESVREAVVVDQKRMVHTSSNAVHDLACELSHHLEAAQLVFCTFPDAEERSSAGSKQLTLGVYQDTVVPAGGHRGTLKCTASLEPQKTRPRCS